MFKILLILAIFGGIFYFSKNPSKVPKLSLPEIPQKLSQINFKNIKEFVTNTASEPAVLGEKAKTESINYLIDQARQLKPEEFQTLQTFLCDPKYSTPLTPSPNLGEGE